MDCAVSCMQDVPAEYTRNCTVASAYEVRRSMVPRTLPKLRLSKYGLPNDDPPQVPGSICNIAMPNQSTRARFLWVCPPFAQAYTAVDKMLILPKYDTLWTAISAYSWIAHSRLLVLTYKRPACCFGCALICHIRVVLRKIINRSSK